MYKRHLHDPDEDVSAYHQKIIDRHVRNQGQNHQLDVNEVSKSKFYRKVETLL